MQEGRSWSVAFVISDADSRRLTRKAILIDVMHMDGVRSISVDPSGTGESEGVASVKIEITAESANDAKSAAENVLLLGRRAAGLPPEVASVAWVIPLRDDGASSVRFLDKAEELLEEEEEESDMAVVAPSQGKAAKERGRNAGSTVFRRPGLT